MTVDMTTPDRRVAKIGTRRPANPSLWSRRAARSRGVPLAVQGRPQQTGSSDFQPGLAVRRAGSPGHASAPQWPGCQLPLQRHRNEAPQYSATARAHTRPQSDPRRKRAIAVSSTNVGGNAPRRRPTISPRRAGFYRNRAQNSVLLQAIECQHPTSARLWPPRSGSRPPPFARSKPPLLSGS